MLTRRTVLASLSGAVASTMILWDGSAGASTAEPLRIGLTSVVVRENLGFFTEWAAYLEERLERPVTFVQRRSYSEIMDLLKSSDVHFAWICGYPYARHRDPEYLELLVVPLWNGAPLYQSYIITSADAPDLQTLADLRGGVFAYSDPDSNSGYLVPRDMLARAGLSPETLFRVSFFTWDHAETVQAVADGVANAGAVDSYVWEYVEATRPALAGRTRVLARSKHFGFPPLVARRGIGPDLTRRARNALLGMTDDAAGRMLLDRLALDGFSVQPDSLYDSIRTLAARWGRPA